MTSLLKLMSNPSHNDLTNDDKLYAQLADIAYEDDIGQKSTKAGKLGWNIDYDLTSPDETVFTKNGEAIVAYPGTRARAKDLVADTDIARGKIPDRVHRSVGHVSRVKSKYSTVKLTGHSLGGTVANEVSKMTGHDATIFNPGSSPIYESKRGDRTRVIRNENDLVSHGFRNQAVNVRNKSKLKNLLIPFTGLYGVGAGQYVDHSLRQFYA